MEIRVLQYFLAIAREETISGAAEFLHLTQPTLSRQMKELEDELGKQLFIRGNRKITLTEDGLFLKKRAEEIVNLVEKTELEITTSDNSLTGDIYIGAGETEGMKIITKAIKKLQSEYPLVRFHIHSGNAEDVTEKLDKGLLDFGILVEPQKFSNYDYLKLPSNDVWGILMRKDSHLATLDKISKKDIKKLPLILSRQELFTNEVAQWLGGNIENLNIVATYNLLYNASLMVEDGLGYAFCFDKLANTSKDSALCFRALDPRLTVGLSFVWKKYQVFSKSSKYFLTKVQEVIREYDK
ncbi:MAG: LysR family transcriptional regulator [Clostridium sp.]